MEGLADLMILYQLNTFVNVLVASPDPIVRLHYLCVTGWFPVRMEVPAIIWIQDTFVAVHCRLVVKTALKVCNYISQKR